MKNLFISLLLCFAAISLSAQNFDANSESVSGDFLLLRSLRGFAPIGDYSVFPRQIAEFADSSNNPGVANEKDAQDFEFNAELERFRQYILNYYSPLLNRYSSKTTGRPDSSNHWLEFQKEHFRPFYYSDGKARILCDISGMTRVGRASLADVASNTGLARLSARAIGGIGENFGFMLDLSNGMRLSGEPLIIAQTDPILGRTFKFLNEDQKFFDKYIGYIQYQSSWFRASFGRQPFAIGFSPIDNLIHSRFAPLFDAFLLDIPYKSIRFTSMHGAIEGLSQSGGAVLNKYAATHRIAVSPADWLAVSITDMIAYSGRGLDFAYLNPLGFYVSTGLGTTQKSIDDNSLLSIDAAIRPWRDAMIYGALLVDDLDFSTLSDTSWLGNNNKHAWQAGAAQLFDIASKPLLISGEYVRINPFVYSHREIVNSWTHLGAPMGYDLQPNSDRWAIQAKYWFSPRIYIQFDLDYTRHGENYLDSTGNIVMKGYNIGGKIIEYPVGNVGGDALRGDGDFLFPEPFRIGNRFLRGNISYARRMRLQFSAEVYSNFFADLRLNYQNRNGGYAPGEFMWATLEFRVGY